MSDKVLYRDKLPLKLWRAIGYSPNEWALERVHRVANQFRTATTARQAGKTVSAAVEIAEMLERPRDEFGPPNVGLLTPNFEKADLVLDQWRSFVVPAFGPDYYTQNLNAHEITVTGTGATLRWMTAENESSVMGHTYSDVLTDESQLISDRIIEKFTPTTAVRNARWLSYGTPDITPDQTWFKTNWVRGQDEDGWQEYYSTTVTAYENPWMSVEAIKRAKASISEREFRMLYLGEWVDEEGSVFLNWENAVDPRGLGEYNPGLNYICSWDPAAHEDFNVVYVAEKSTKRIVYMERWNRRPLQETYDRVERVSIDWGSAPVFADESGMGIPMVHEMRKRGVSVHGITFTKANKMETITRLASDMEHRNLTFAKWPALVSEIKAFMFHRTPSGVLTAEAAAGYNDDCVMSLVVMNEALRQASSSGNEGFNWMAERPRDRQPVREGAQIIGRFTTG